MFLYWFIINSKLHKYSILRRKERCDARCDITHSSLTSKDNVFYINVIHTQTMKCMFENTLRNFKCLPYKYMSYLPHYNSDFLLKQKLFIFHVL